MFPASVFQSKLLPAVDFLLVVLAGMLAYFVRFGHLTMDDRYLLVILLGAFITVTVLVTRGVYLSAEARLSGHMRRLLVPLLIAGLSMAMLGYFGKSSAAYSRLWAAGWFFGVLTGMLAARWVLNRMGDHPSLQRWFGRRLVLVGDADLVRGVAQQIENSMAPWLTVVRTIPVDFFGASADANDNVDGRVDEHVDELVRWSRGQQVDDIVVVPGEIVDQQGMNDLLKRLQVIPANIHLGPLALLQSFSASQRVNIGELALLNVTRQPLNAGSRLLKSVEDRLLALLLLVLFAPLMLLIAVLIKLESTGPVFFRQERYGFQRNVITVTKFRSMHVSQEADPEVTSAVRDDHRVTRVGQFIRRFSLDELPQLFNVLDGSMSLIGPRPQAVPHDDHYSSRIENYLSRHKVKPGLTGWAQANGFRGEIQSSDQMRERVEHDLYYVENWSLMLDLEILFRTVVIVLTGRNAY